MRLHFIVVHERNAQDALDSVKALMDESGFMPVAYGAVESESGVFVPDGDLPQNIIDIISNIDNINNYIRASITSTSNLHSQITECLNEHAYNKAIELVTQAREQYYLELQNTSLEKYDVRKSELFGDYFMHVGCTHVPSVYTDNYKTKTFVVATEAFYK